MNLWTYRMCILIISFFIYVNVHSQEVILSSGDTFSGEGGNISYSLGQIAYNTYFGEEHSLGEGVQQLLDVDINSMLKNDLKSSAFQIFPNPVKKQLKLYKPENKSSYSYEVFDLNGFIQFKGIMETEFTKLDVSGLRKGIFLLKLYDSADRIQIFKIIKL